MSCSRTPIIVAIPLATRTRNSSKLRANLPPLNNCVVFFEYCVRHKVICVPGIFFDVNPFHRRRFHKSPYIDKLRMSYGPAWPNLKQAVKGMKEIIELAKAGQLPPLDEPPPN